MVGVSAPVTSELSSQCDTRMRHSPRLISHLSTRIPVLTHQYVWLSSFTRHQRSRTGVVVGIRIDQCGYLSDTRSDTHTHANKEAHTHTTHRKHRYVSYTFSFSPSLLSQFVFLFPVRRSSQLVPIRVRSFREVRVRTKRSVCRNLHPPNVTRYTSVVVSVLIYMVQIFVRS